ncbi:MULTISPECIES: SMP-30/gluconolactonase/LRE family protein [unclassified Mesorhizobium]|uniref:SMP-30/gluconolactonase/LRE family protein n=1 Tax=unclassified Mesorhizobium TaxID=325217 RepID=UPI000BB06A18|nr:MULTISPECIES: SMP-30/gluconolactonase/LRE family protein [unclassified Mesorhizobium]TGT57104.1 SMP-30/gluconolactonase/LRE family protein [Mesorhizobium sp. M00.F.Ca.ET.170.01.1.1]AZO10714.1 SMP-30/gluconolactonase/LRE family protein [Mesorhizobium sp. M3A.F.Ca.ET.080.04.2.1]PBB88748.1 gluconolactonase [Mesorhizobium sp. WSM3876]RWB70573.1 MAG: SMP-30/gluconolactonase/LRE family protein [Mesorhizobium sp.]RWB92528.1 MAG: SMP-30/gluconolactonase/LRE family protein [Mesorhizobium sp.]
MSMPARARHSGFDDVVGNAAMERLATGYGFLEGPVWHPYEKWLVFSDIPGNRIYRRGASGEIELFRDPSQMANGNTLDRQGRLVTCEHATSRVTRAEPNGATTVLAAHYQNVQLNSPNDIVVATGGSIYFTDPTYGRLEFYGVPRPQELAFQGVYRIDGDGARLTLLADDFAQPNGLCFSLDESRLFVNDTARGHIRVFGVEANGDLNGGAVWAVTEGHMPGAPDGMKIDSRGNLYCTGPGGIHVFDASGDLLGVIATPEDCANFTFGDEDLRGLYIAASTSLYRLRVRVPGLRLF